MALKRGNKADAGFSMAAMTDFIFLLLIFFMLISTVLVNPNMIKVMLPQSAQQNSEKSLTKVIIDKELNYYVAFGKEEERQVSFDEIEPSLKQIVLDKPEMYIALYADETVPHGEVVKILNIANINNFKLVIATRPIKKQ